MRVFCADQREGEQNYGQGSHRGHLYRDDER